MTKQILQAIEQQQQQPEQNTTPLDPSAPDNLRLTQDFTNTVGVKKLLTRVPVRKPSKQEYIRVRPGEKFRSNFPIIELKEDREEYIVAAGLVPELVGEFES